MKNYISAIGSPLGKLTLLSDGDSIRGLWIENQKYYAPNLGECSADDNLTVFARARDWLSSYFSGEKPPMELPLAPEGSGFRRSVWDILLTIPYGEVMTYGEIAGLLSKDSGKRMSAQAVGGAVGHNPISILIPCHRVIGSDGSLTGYAGGLDKKTFLLKLEGALTGSMYIPKRGTAL